MTIEDLEKTVADLSPDDFVRFRAWFEQLGAACFNATIERDAKAGSLDRLADAALDDLRTGPYSRAVRPVRCRISPGLLRDPRPNLASAQF